MEKLIIHKNQGEVIKCKLDIDGADLSETEIRLCLQFENNKNLYFNGTINKDGDCSITIPKLKEIENCTGKSCIEVIADSVYFKVYEAPFELKNSVEVKMSGVQTNKGAKIKVEQISLGKNILQEEPKEVKKEEPTEKKENFSSFDSYLKRRKTIFK